MLEEVGTAENHATLLPGKCGGHRPRHCGLAVCAKPKTTTIRWKRIENFSPEGVASGDPDSSSVLLWTRHLPGTQNVTAEVAEDPGFAKVVATASAPVSASDWTCRVLVGGLKPARVYWYRFTDAEGNGSRVGRTITAPDHQRLAAGAIRLCQLPERQSGRAERLSPHDLRG